MKSNFSTTTVSADNAWDEPDMTLIMGGRRAPPRLETKLFGRCASWLEEQSRMRGCPVDYLVGALLPISASLIGSTRVSQPWLSWKEPIILWSCCVGDPSSGKSIAFQAFKEPIRAIDQAWAESFEQTMNNYTRHAETAKAKYEEWREEIKDAVANKAIAPDLPEDAKEPEMPQQPRVSTSDTTVEKLAEILSSNPRGIAVVRDELAGLIGGFDSYSGSGKDRAFWLECFTGGSYKRDRMKSSAPVDVPYLSVSIYGTIQPERLNSMLLKTEDDGLCARFMMFFPEPMPVSMPSDFVDDDVMTRALQRLAEIGFDTDRDGKPVPKVIPFTESAKEAFHKWRLRNQQDEFASHGKLKSHIGKLHGLVARLALVFAYLDWAMGEDSEPPSQIELEHIARAADFADDYLKPSAERVYGDAALPLEQKNASLIAKEIVRKRLHKINITEVTRKWRLPGMSKTQSVREAVSVLEELRWLYLDEVGSSELGGRPRGDYTVNPRIWEADHGQVA